jgi:hypothetical protein
MTTIKTFLVTASCGLVLLGAVAAHAAIASNGANPNGRSPNELTTLVPSDHTLGTPLSQGLSLHGLSRSGLGKPAVDARTP